MSLAEAFRAALDALSAPANGGSSEMTASQLEVAILDRARDHRTFRRLRAARLEELIGESRAIPADADADANTDAKASDSAADAATTGDAAASGAPSTGPGTPGAPSTGPGTPGAPSTGPGTSGAASTGPGTSADSGPPTGPDPSGSDRGSGLGGPAL
jgi:hypothetical protein